ncbi:MAG: solute-binding protein [Eubacteriales bacterium]|nr:solute-binding protein [Eubacteriales bacterium]
MSSTRDKLGRIGVVLASSFFRIVLYACIVVMLFWVGKTSYKFGHDIFNQKAMSPGEGQEISVVINEGTSVYQIGKILEEKGLIEDAKVFVIQEFFSNYHKELKPGTYILSTAYTPTRMMGIMAGDADQEGASNT